jgi:hypothetical protein
MEGRIQTKKLTIKQMPRAVRKSPRKKKPVQKPQETPESDPAPEEPEAEPEVTPSIDEINLRNELEEAATRTAALEEQVQNLMARKEAREEEAALKAVTLEEEVNSLRKALIEAQEQDAPSSDDLREEEPHEEDDFDERRLHSERPQATGEPPLEPVWAQKIQTPNRLNEKMSPKDVRASIKRVIDANPPPGSAATTDTWDKYIKLLYRNWVGNHWPNNEVSAAALGAGLGCYFNPGQKLQSFLTDINVSKGSNQSMNMISETNSFTITTEKTLSSQAIDYLNLVRIEVEDHDMGLEDERCRPRFIKKVLASPFKAVWDKISLQHPGGPESIKDITRAIRQCQLDPAYPVIKIAQRHPAIGLNRLNPDGAELISAQEAVNQPHCLACDKAEHQTEDCPLVENFHINNPGLYRPVDPKNKQASHCAVHGACTHKPGTCTLLPRLRNEPSLKFQVRVRRATGDKSPPKGTPNKDHKRKRERDDNKVLLQRLNLLDKEVKRLKTEKAKNKKKSKPPPKKGQSDSNSGSNS